MDPPAGAHGRPLGPPGMPERPFREDLLAAEGLAESGVQHGSKRLHGCRAVGMRSGSPAPRIRGGHTHPSNIPEAPVMRRATNRAPTTPHMARNMRSAQQVPRCRSRARNATHALATTSARQRVTIDRPLRRCAVAAPRICDAHQLAGLTAAHACWRADHFAKVLCQRKITR